MLVETIFMDKFEPLLRVWSWLVVQLMQILDGAWIVLSEKKLITCFFL